LGIPKSELPQAISLAGGFFVFGLAFIPAKSLRALRQGAAGTGLLCILMMFPNCGGTGGGGGGGTGVGPGNYNITINAYTVSNTSGTPDSTANIALKIN
jgi:hypothetical protein